MTPLTRTNAHWKLRTRKLELGRRTLVMGVVNVTPDSFSDGGQFFETEDAVKHALKFLEEGADILDLGAESTRPGSLAGTSSAISTGTEQARLLPVIQGILAVRPGTLISVDTYKSETARAALSAGAEIINDVSGALWDKDMLAVCSASACGVVLMHTRGRPEDWREQSKLPADELIELVRSGLAKSLQCAVDSGIAVESIVLDPGYGFGKKFDENYTMLARQSELLALGRPLLAGVSRKSFLGHTLAELHGGKLAPVEARETASVAAMVTAIIQGASIVRVHNVRSAVEAARIADAVLSAAD